MRSEYLTLHVKWNAYIYIIVYTTTQVSHEKLGDVLMPPADTIQCLFYVAVTAPEEVKILYTVFSSSKTAFRNARPIVDVNGKYFL